MHWDVEKMLIGPSLSFVESAQGPANNGLRGVIRGLVETRRSIDGPHGAVWSGLDWLLDPHV